MRYEPRTEEELEKERQDALNASMLPDGEYDFDIAETSNAPSKASGEEMITLKLNVFDNDGNGHIVFDYLTAKMGWKLRHAADACGIIDVYESGSLIASSFDFCSGKVKIKTQKGNKQYPNPKNVVDDYVKRGTSEAAPKAPVNAPVGHPINDEIPF